MSDFWKRNLLHNADRFCIRFFSSPVDYDNLRVLTLKGDFKEAFLDFTVSEPFTISAVVPYVCTDDDTGLTFGETGSLAGSLAPQERHIVSIYEKAGLPFMRVGDNRFYGDQRDFAVESAYYDSLQSGPQMFDVELLPAVPHVTSIEVTQGIQTIWIVVDFDNSVPIVARKTTLVRAFVESGDRMATANLHASLSVRSYGGDNGELLRTKAANLPNVKIGASKALPSILDFERDRSDHSVNFIVTFDRQSDEYALEFEVTVIIEDEDASIQSTRLAKPAAVGTVLVAFVDAPPPIRLISLRAGISTESDPSTQIMPPPSLDEVQAFLGLSYASGTPAIDGGLVALLPIADDGITIASDQEMYIRSNDPAAFSEYDLTVFFDSGSLGTNTWRAIFIPYIEGQRKGVWGPLTSTIVAMVNGPGGGQYVGPTDMVHELYHAMVSDYHDNSSLCPTADWPRRDNCHDGTIGTMGVDVPLFSYVIANVLPFAKDVQSLFLDGAFKPSNYTTVMTYCYANQWVSIAEWFALYWALAN